MTLTHDWSPEALAQLTPGVTRPELRRDCPLLWRGPATLQIGTALDAPVVDRISHLTAAWLTGLNGLRTWDQVAADHPAQPLGRNNSDSHVGFSGDAGESCDVVQPLEAQRLLRIAFLAGAIDDGAQMPDRLRWLSVIERDEVQPDLAAAALTYRDPIAANHMMDRRLGIRVSVIGQGQLATEVGAAIRLSGMALVADAEPRVNIRVLAEGTHPGVVEECDSAVHDGPHLVVAAYGGRGVVGPLVVPGATSCLRCGHLLQRDTDAAWPLVSLQITQVIGRLPVWPADRLLCRLLATETALLIRAWADDPSPEGEWANTAVEVLLPTGAATRIARPTHPLCGCRWPGAGAVA